MTVRTMFLAGALACALPAMAATRAYGSCGMERSEGTRGSTFVVRASAPIALGEGHGDAHFHATLFGWRWRVALGWRAHGEKSALAIGITRRKLADET